MQQSDLASEFPPLPSHIAEFASGPDALPIAVPSSTTLEVFGEPRVLVPVEQPLPPATDVRPKLHECLTKCLDMYCKALAATTVTDVTDALNNAEEYVREMHDTVNSLRPYAARQRVRDVLKQQVAEKKQVVSRAEDALSNMYKS